METITGFQPRASEKRSCTTFGAPWCTPGRDLLRGNVEVDECGRRLLGQMRQ
jgi:hypothetical protein